MFLFFRDIGNNWQVYIIYSLVWSTYGIYHISNQHIDRSIPFAIVSQIWRPLWTENVSRIPPMLVPHPEVFLSAGKIMHCNLRSRRNMDWIKCAKETKTVCATGSCFFSMLIPTIRLGKDVIISENPGGLAGPNRLRPFLLFHQHSSEKVLECWTNTNKGLSPRSQIKQTSN